MRSFLTSVLVTWGGGGVNEGTARTQEGWEGGLNRQRKRWLFGASLGWRIVARSEMAAGPLRFNRLPCEDTKVALKILWRVWESNFI